MRPATMFYVCAGLLLLGAAAAFVMGGLTDAGASLCEGQRPGVCESYQDDHKPWLWLSLALLSGTVAAFIYGKRVSR